MWCRIVDKHQKAYVLGCFYDPTSDCNLSLAEFLAVLEERAQLHNSKILVGGDFNLPGINWGCMMTKAGARHQNKNEMLLNVLHNSGLEQVVKTPTRIADNVSNILDLFITNVPQLISKVTTCVGISDHLAIIIRLEDVWRRPKVKRNVKLYDKADFDVINYRFYQHY